MNKGKDTYLNSTDCGNIIEAPKWVEYIGYLMICSILFVAIPNIYSFMDGSIDAQIGTLNIIGIVLFFLYVTIRVHYHEYAHSKAARLRGYNTKVNIGLRNGGNYCLIYGKIKPKDFVLIAIAPFVCEIVAVFLISSLLLPSIYLGPYLMLVLALKGASSDFWLFIQGVKAILQNRKCYMLNEKPGSFRIIDYDKVNDLKDNVHSK